MISWIARGLLLLKILSSAQTETVESSTISLAKFLQDFLDVEDELNTFKKSLEKDSENVGLVKNDVNKEDLGTDNNEIKGYMIQNKLDPKLEEIPTAEKDVSAFEDAIPYSNDYFMRSNPQALQRPARLYMMQNHPQNIRALRGRGRYFESYNPRVMRKRNNFYRQGRSVGSGTEDIDVEKLEESSLEENKMNGKTNENIDASKIEDGNIKIAESGKFKSQMRQNTTEESLGTKNKTLNQMAQNMTVLNVTKSQTEMFKDNVSLGNETVIKQVREKRRIFNFDGDYEKFNDGWDKRFSDNINKENNDRNDEDDDNKAIDPALVMEIALKKYREIKQRENEKNRMKELDDETFKKVNEDK